MATVREDNPGHEFTVFDIPRVGRVGLAICYDGSFPETVRQLAWLGAEIVIQPTLTPTRDRGDGNGLRPRQRLDQPGVRRQRQRRRPRRGRTEHRRRPGRHRAPAGGTRRGDPRRRTRPRHRRPSAPLRRRNQPSMEPARPLREVGEAPDVRRRSNPHAGLAKATPCNDSPVEAIADAGICGRRTHLASPRPSRPSAGLPGIRSAS
nr:carbon-nitrogen hydrolase family protein [Streptomyces sp. RKAG290]